MRSRLLRQQGGAPQDGHGRRGGTGLGAAPHNWRRDDWASAARAPVDDRVTLDPPVLDDGLPQLRYELENALVDQGLLPKEAQAMVETWRDSWFEEGARLIYIMPAASVDEVLPLRIDPAPSRTARVFVGRIELLTPDVLGAVAEALARKDWSTIDRHRRFLQPILERIDSGNPDKAGQAERVFQQMVESHGAGCR